MSSTTTPQYSIAIKAIPTPSNQNDKELLENIERILSRFPERVQNEVGVDASVPDVNESSQANQITFINLNRYIFGWSWVNTEFEYFSNFSCFLKQPNSFLDPIMQQNQETAACIRFKHLLWSMFSGFEHTWYENAFANLREQNSQSQKKEQEQILKYYASIVSKSNSEKYKQGPFIEQFKILAKITKTCPIRVDLLEKLHTYLVNGANGEGTVPNSHERTYRLHAKILIDREFNKYCILRAIAVNGDFDTSYLTRKYKEESFLRVSFVRTPENLDVTRRLAAYKDTDLADTGEFKLGSVIHNVSVLIHMMRDLCKTVPEIPKEVQKVNQELAETNVKRMNVELRGTLTDLWSTSSSDCLEEYALRKSYDPTLTEPTDDLMIAGKHFKYLMTTNSGFYRNAHIFSVEKYKSIMKWIFSKGSIRKDKDNPLKLSVRMGLWLTPSISMDLESNFILQKCDSSFDHIDGCGRVSISLAKRMTAKWNQGKKWRNAPFTPQNVGPTEWNSVVWQDRETEYIVDLSVNQSHDDYYSAFQIRLDGIKGMLLVDESLGDQEVIQPTSQQCKFDVSETLSKASNKIIQIVQCSQPTSPARLNFALISLIVACAQNHTSMQDYITKLAWPEIKNLLENKAFAIEFAQKHNDIKSFNMLGTGCSLLETFLAGYYQNYVRPFKIVVESSRRLFGVADFWNVLRPGEVFIKISNLENGTQTGPGFTELDVLVTKEPCYHRGDLRKLKAVTKDELKSRTNGEYVVGLQDVIVFSSSEEERSEPSKICGSDLDGDQYFVCWDQKIVTNLKESFPPGEFKSVKYKDLDKCYKKQVEKFSKEIKDTLEDKNTTSGDSTSTEENESLDYHRDMTHLMEDAMSILTNPTAKNPQYDNSQQDETVKYSNLRETAAQAAANFCENTMCFNINDLFDVHMRLIDHWKHEWVEDQYWKSLEPLVEKLSVVLDSPKSKLDTFIQPMVQDLPEIFDNLPKYPHFHPSKRKEECQKSESAAGKIYDNLTTKIKRYLGGNPEDSLNTLYDEIKEMKLSFLFGYATKNSSTDDTECNIREEAFESVVPSVRFKDICEWYENKIEPPTKTNLLKKEAACTMLWKLITFRQLQQLQSHTDPKLYIIYLRDEEKLSNIDKVVNILKNDCGTCLFYCITEECSKEIGFSLNNENSLSEENGKTPILLDKDQISKLIECLGHNIEKRFWVDMKLPYPHLQRSQRDC